MNRCGLPFLVIDGKPRQKIQAELNATIRLVDLSDAEEAEQTAREMALADAAAPFELGQCGLFRISLIKLTADRFVLLTNMHHIISDDWSTNVLVRELVELYNHKLTAVSSDMPVRSRAEDTLRLQYRDYACWQNQYLQSDRAKAHLEYWHDNLDGNLPVLDLPTDFPRPSVKTYRGKTLALGVDRELTARLNEWSQQQGASLFMTLAAIVNVLLHRYTGQQDLVVGFPIAGRNHPDLEPQIGFYVNTLPLRSQVHSNMPFDELLEQVKSTCTSAYEHQAYPFDRLVDELNLARDVSRSPLIDVVVVMQSGEPAELALRDAKVSPLIDDYEGSKFDLHFAFELRAGRLEASIVYNTDLFRSTRIQRMGRHLSELIRCAVTNPTQAVGCMNLLPLDEQQRLLEFNPEPQAFDCPQTLVELFESQVARTPDAVAVVLPGEERISLSYAELNLRANQLAYHLRSLGVGPNQLVSLCLDRSLDTVVAVLGVLKAGAAYLPFDTAHPPQRLQFMWQDTGAEVLVTRQAFAQKLTTKPRHLVCLDTQREELARQPAENPPVLANPNDLAYVIYTSGSTGQPKGVPVSHRNVGRLFAATEPWFQFSSHDVWTLFHSYAFDFSVWEIWGALLHGGRLLLVPHEITRSPEAFYQLLVDERVTVLNQTPSAFRQLVQFEARRDSDLELDLRLVIFGGEALDLPSLQPWFARHPDDRPQLVNMYGITETTVHVTYRPITGEDVHQAASLIGRPLPDLQIRLLDQALNPVPIGVRGEICVGGAGVTNGYWNRPQLTSERFVSDPLSTDPAAKLYRSGDLARYRENGDLEYLGRLDDQIQVRGFRVELGEIAAALVDHPDVDDAVVIAQDDANGIRLLAYFIAAPAAEEDEPGRENDSAQSPNPDATSLRSHLRERLPDYMIPAACVPVEAFPLTANGKLDRDALPPPADEQLGLATHFIAPRNDLEKQVARVFAEILQRDKIGVDDNFFDLGVNSLLLVEINTRLRDCLQREIPIVWMFQYSTVRTLAAQLTPREQPAQTVLDTARQRASLQRQARVRRTRPGNRAIKGDKK